MSVFGLPGRYISRGGMDMNDQGEKTGGNIGAESYRRFLDGEEEGLAEIVREYQNGLIAFLQSFVWDYCEAEELAQTVFFKLWSRKPVFREECRFKTGSLRWHVMRPWIGLEKRAESQTILQRITKATSQMSWIRNNSLSRRSSKAPLSRPFQNFLRITAG